MKMVHRQILKAIISSQEEEPSPQGMIPIRLMLAPKLADVFNNDLMKLIQEVELLDQEGFVEMERKPWSGFVAITLKGDKGTQRHTAQDFETIEGTKK
jgi:hypothetical protein